MRHMKRTTSSAVLWPAALAISAFVLPASAQSGSGLGSGITTSRGMQRGVPGVMPTPGPLAVLPRMLCRVWTST
jgi:hypothetical protein